MKTLSSMIRTHGAQRPDKVALICGDDQLTYSELDRRSSQVANALQQAGVCAGDRVAFFELNGLEYFEVLLGAAKIRAIVVGINYRLAAREVAYIVNNAEAEVLVYGAEFAEVVAEIQSSLETVKTLIVIGADTQFTGYTAWRDAASTADPGIEADRSDIAFQVYSSGTTGHPKGVLLSNDNLFTLLPTSSRAWRVTGASINLVALPLFHIGGSAWAMVGMYRAGTLIIARELDPSRLIECIGQHRVTHGFVVPALLQFMQQAATTTADFSSLQVMVYGASPISETVLEGAVRLMGCDFAQAYGLTETTGAIVTLPPEDHVLDGPNRHRLRAAGKPHEGVELKVVHPETCEDLDRGIPGEVWTRSRQNMVGYWRNDQATRETLTADGWLRTGDIGYFDADGYLYIHDRVKDMIISGGENIYPTEVENVLLKHPNVAEVAVIGIPSDTWGESPFAIVVPVSGDNLDTEELVAFARMHLARFKIPVGFTTRDELPRTPSGKVLKRYLRAPFWRGHTRGVH